MEQRPNAAGKVCPICEEWLEMTTPEQDEAMLREHFSGHTAEIILKGKSDTA